MRRYLTAAAVAMLIAVGAITTQNIMPDICSWLSPDSPFWSLLCENPAGGGGSGAGD